MIHLILQRMHRGTNCSVFNQKKAGRIKKKGKIVFFVMGGFIFFSPYNNLMITTADILLLNQLISGILNQFQFPENTKGHWEMC